MTYKNFEFLKDKERYNNNLIKLNPRKEQVFESRKNIFFTKFKKFIDKNKNVVQYYINQNLDKLLYNRYNLIAQKWGIIEIVL